MIPRQASKENSRQRPRVRTIRQAPVLEVAQKLKWRSGPELRPRFAFLLGAGASISSGIPGTQTMIEDFKKALDERRSPGDREQSFDQWLRLQRWWRAGGNEYGRLFEVFERKPLARQRYIETLIDGKLPSVGYLFLSCLIRDGFVDTVVTTNFDDLINSACMRWTNLGPAVYIAPYKGLIRVRDRRPKVLKLHGDFRYERLRNTARELARGDPNMTSHIHQLFTEQGLIVVGYAGNDKSIIKILAECPAQNDLYWCVMAGHRPNAQVQDLLRAKDGALVEIESFDRFFDEVCNCVGFRLDSLDGEYEQRRTAVITELKSSNSPNLSKYLGETVDAAEIDKAKVLAMAVDGLALDGRARDALKDLVRRDGPNIWEDLHRLEALLRDKCGELRLEIKVLLEAALENAPHHLYTRNPDVPVELVRGQLQSRLRENSGLAPEAAAWAVESWEQALRPLEDDPSATA